MREPRRIKVFRALNSQRSIEIQLGFAFALLIVLFLLVLASVAHSLL